MLWFEFDHCPQPGTGAGFRTVEVDYRYRGRPRSTTLELNRQVMVMGAESCPGAVTPEDTPSLRDAERKRWRAAIGGEFYARFGERSSEMGPLRLDADNVGRDLCRYLRGVTPATGDDGLEIPGAVEPLEARAVFQLDDADDDLAVVIVDAALEAFCPEFGDRRDELVALVEET